MRRNWIAGAAGVLLAGLAGVAFAQAGVGVDDEATAAAAAQAGPPPMPQPITMAQRPDATGGEALYVEHCMSCHGPNGMGTGLLGRRMEVSLLEERDNLPAQYVVQAARRGIGNMPAIPRGEVSDEQLQAIADYLAAGPHPQANPQPQAAPR
jgi:mono/diheme cytochrome c family protein